MLLLTNPNPVL